MSEEFVTVHQLEEVLEVEQSRWVASPLELLGLYEEFVDGLLADGVPGAIASCCRFDRIQTRPDPGIVAAIAWAVSKPLTAGNCSGIRS